MPVNYVSEEDPRKAAKNQRDRVMSRGDELLQQEQDRANTMDDRSQGYLDKIDPYVTEMVEGRGGYTPEERDMILQTGREGENYLTPEEQRASYGDTGSWDKYFNPEGSEQAQSESAALQRGAAQRLNERVTGAVNPDQLRQSEGYRSRADQTLKDTRTGTWNTILSNADNVRGAIDTEGENVRGAIDPSAVQASQGFLDDYNMSPEEKQDFIEAQGITAGAGYRAATGDLQRKALAAGANPMGVGAYRSRMEREAAGAGADAMLKARSEADRLDAERKLTGEQLRESGGRYLTDTKVGSELQLGNQRQQAEQNMGSQAIETERKLGENELSQTNAQEANRQNAEQYLTDASTRAAQIGSGAELDTEGSINNQQRQVGQFNTTTGTGIAQGQDTASADRGYRAATNRQNVSLTNQNNASNRAQTVGNARINQQNAGIGVQQQNAQMQNQNAESARNRQQQTYSTQTSGTNQATGLQLEADNAAKNRPSTFQKVMGGISGAANVASMFLEDGGVVTEPTVAVLGEAGPEAVVPLTAPTRPPLSLPTGKPQRAVGGPMGSPYRAMQQPAPAMGKGVVRKPHFYGAA